MFKKENRMTIVFILVILFFVGLAFIGVRGVNNQTVKELPTKTNKTFVKSDHPIVGKKDAPVEMMVFTDYQCPHCREWTKTAYPQIKSNLLDTGKAKLIFVNYAFLGTASFYSAMASDFVYHENPMKWTQFKDELYDNQSVLTNSFIASKVVKYVNGFTKDEIKNKLEKEQMYIDDVLSDYNQGKSMGVDGTPTLFINGKKVQNAFDISSIEKTVAGES